MKKENDTNHGLYCQVRYTTGAKIFIGGLCFGFLFIVVLIIYIMNNPY